MATPSGISALGDLRPGSHVGQLYWDLRDLLDTLVPFFAAGLHHLERCIWVCSQPLCVQDARNALAIAVPDLAERERVGQIEIVDHDEWFEQLRHRSHDAVIQRWLDAEQDALLAGYRGLRINGNACWLEPDQWSAFADYEADAHAAFRNSEVIALCSYSLAHCSSHQIVDVLHNHAETLLKSDTGWAVVHGATAALASLDGTPARARFESAYASARDAREHLVLLNRLTASLGEVTARTQLVELVRDVVAKELQVPSLLVVEADREDEAPLVAEGFAAGSLRSALLIPVVRAIWSTDVAQLPGAPAELRAFAIAPVTVGSRRLATLVLGFTEDRAASASYRALVEDVARQLALALDRVTSYERVEHERERAESASRAKDEFLAMLGHELRNPLSPILTATQLMRLRGEDHFEKERTVIERQTRHMVRLVDDLLDVSRITRGKVELRRRPVEIGEVVAQAVELASPAMEERSHRLTLDVASSGMVVHADAHRLAQVIANLLNNAAKYTPHGGSIHVSAYTVDSAVVITVKDSGIGIDPKLLPHVFDLFVQGRQGIDRAAGGLGLGLAIARTLVELHGGTIEAHSAGQGQGSELTIELPRYANARPGSRNNNSGAFALTVMRPFQVLVVDDNEDAAFLFSEALRKLGHQVEVAHDGPSALAVARQHPPEIAFLDIGLPVMDGYELGRRLKELGGTPPKIVAVTGYGHSSDRVRSREAGFDLHLVKPVDFSAIQDALAKLGG